MKAAELIEKRQPQWSELEQYVHSFQYGSRQRLTGAQMNRFAALYRAACADLALADSYSLPPDTVQYLHDLVAQSHNQLYRADRMRLSNWLPVLMYDVPHRVFHDKSVRVVFVLFWGMFFLSMWLSYEDTLWPQFDNQPILSDFIGSVDQMHSDAGIDLQGGRQTTLDSPGFYIWNNVNLCLKTFVEGILIIPGLVFTMFNSYLFGGTFGYYARPDAPVDVYNNLVNWATGHLVFEFAALILATAAGVKLGMSWINTKGLTRKASLQKNGVETIPIIGCAVVMMVLAAFIEGWIAPSNAPYWVRFTIMILSLISIIGYFIVLGIRQGGRHEIR